MSKSFDRFASVLFLVIGLAFVVESKKIAASAYGSNVGPDIFPMALGIILILLSIRLFFETKNYLSIKSKMKELDYKKFIIILISAIIYAFLLETIGYVITTFVFLLISFQVLQKGGWLRSTVIAGLFSFGVYYLFVEVLEGSMPGFPIWLN